ncbi:hypothetical protein [Streptomyces coeruleorubidus]|uniref:hypothetical protein n=1 Tax=Streptomyces coeruleorubidus TaxID=116188 RepID=UPI003F53E665
MARTGRPKAELTLSDEERAALEEDIRNWITAWNTDPKPYVRTKTADEITSNASPVI